MNEFKIDKDSWHYKLMLFNSAWRSDWWIQKRLVDGTMTLDEAFHVDHFLPSDFCEYWRRVLLWPGLLFLFNIAIYIFFIGSLATLTPDEAVEVGSIVVQFLVIAFIAIAGVCLMAYLNTKLSDLGYIKKKKVLKKKKPSFISTLYKSYKEKYCPYVVYEEGEK